MFDDFGVSCSHFFCGKHPISSRSGCPFRNRSLAFLNAMALQLHGLRVELNEEKTLKLKASKATACGVLGCSLGWKILHGVWGYSCETMMENLHL